MAEIGSKGNNSVWFGYFNTSIWWIFKVLSILTLNIWTKTKGVEWEWGGWKWIAAVTVKHIYDISINCSPSKKLQVADSSQAQSSYDVAGQAVGNTCAINTGRSRQEENLASVKRERGSASCVYLGLGGNKYALVKLRFTLSVWIKGLYSSSLLRSNNVQLRV